MPSDPRVSDDRGNLGCDIGQLRFVSAVQLVHEEARKADHGDSLPARIVISTQARSAAQSAPYLVGERITEGGGG